MTRVHFHLADPQGAPLSGAVALTPTRRVTVGNTVRLPVPVSVQLADGEAVVDVLASTTQWVWRVTGVAARGIAGTVLVGGRVAVTANLFPDNVNYRSTWGGNTEHPIVAKSVPGGLYIDTITHPLNWDTLLGNVYFEAGDYVLYAPRPAGVTGLLFYNVRNIRIDNGPWLLTDKNIAPVFTIDSPGLYKLIMVWNPLEEVYWYPRIYRLIGERERERERRLSDSLTVVWGLVA